MPKGGMRKEDESAFVGVAVLYSYINAKAKEKGGTRGPVTFVLGEELTQNERKDLPQDLKDFIRVLGGARCFRVMEKKG